MVRSDTWSGWPIGPMLSPALEPQSARRPVASPPQERMTMAKHVDYYVSLNSPWTYLGSKRFETIAQKHGADVAIWPVDFGSVFAVSGGLPLPKRAPQRQTYRMMELKRWRDHLGVKTTLQPQVFPRTQAPAPKHS